MWLTCLPLSTAFPGANREHKFAKWSFWKLPFNLPYPFPLTCPGRLSVLSEALIRVAVAMTALTALFGLPRCRETDVYSGAEGKERKAAASLTVQTNDSNVITEWTGKVSVLSISEYGLAGGKE